MTLKKYAVLTFVASSFHAQAAGVDDWGQESGTPKNFSSTQSLCSQGGTPILGSADCLEVDRASGWRANLPPLFASLRIEIPPYSSPVDSSPVDARYEIVVGRVLEGAFWEPSSSRLAIVPDVAVLSPSAPRKIDYSSCMFADLDTLPSAAMKEENPQFTSAGLEVNCACSFDVPYLPFSFSGGVSYKQPR